MATQRWVEVVFLMGEEYDKIADFGIQEMAEYLAQWDYGESTNGTFTRDEAPWGSSAHTYEVSVGGQEYLLAVNHKLGYASLNRRPLGEG